MKRLILIAGFIVLTALVAVGSLPFILSTQAVKSRISESLSALTGQPVSFSGNPKISFNPFLGIELSDVKVSGSSQVSNEAPILTVETIKGHLSILDAITGDIRIDEYQLIRPRMMLVENSDGQSNWEFTTGTLKNAYDSNVIVTEENNGGTAQSADLGMFSFVDGTINYTNHIDDTVETITNLNGSLDWGDTNSAARLSTNAIWRNENIQLEVSANEPLKMIAGSQSKFSFKLASEPINFEIDGDANMIAGLFVKGQMSSSSPSIARLADFMQIELGEVDIFGEWSVSGILEGTLETALLNEARISINDSVATGVIRVSDSETERTRIDGTLAFDDVDSNAIVQGLKSMTSNPSIGLGDADLDIDIRLSANSLNLGFANLENIAASITANQDSWNLDMGNASLFDGTIAASLSNVSEDGAKRLILRAKTQDTDLSQIFELIGENSLGLSGTGSITADLRTSLPIQESGPLPISGQMSLSSQAGIIQGIDLPNLLSNAALESSQDNEQSAEGETAFDDLQLNVFLNNSRASISKASVKAGETNILLLGDLDLIKGTLALTAQETSEDGPGLSQLIIGGTLQAPLISTKDKAAKPQQKSTEPNAENPSSQGEDASH